MYIQIDGNIGSGKTSVLTFLSALMPVDVAVYPEDLPQWGPLLRRYHKNKKEWSLALNLDVIRSHERVDFDRTNHVIVERGPLTTRHVFSEISLNDGDLTQNDIALIDKYCGLFSPRLPDVFVYLDVPVDVCYDRIKSNHREKNDDSMISYDDLKILEFRYQSLFKAHPNIPVHTITWRNDEDARTFGSRVLIFLEDLLQDHQKKNGVHHDQ